MRDIELFPGNLGSARHAVRVMVWLGLESWSDTFEFFGEGV